MSAESDYDKIIKDFNQNLIDETGLGMNPRVQFLAKMLMSELDKLRDEEREKEREELRSRTITLCGSTRFTGTMLDIQWELSRRGWIVLSWCYVPNKIGSHLAEEIGEKESFDSLHKRKILLSDAVLIINLDWYVGSSTTSELQYAREHGKKVFWYEGEREGELNWITLLSLPYFTGKKEEVID